jgi:hypothetical protein
MPHNVSANITNASLPVTGSVNANVTNPSLAVTGPLTNAELRASAVPVTGPADIGVLGTIAALNATVTLNTSGFGSAIVDIRGTFAATLAFQGTVDGTSWVTINALPAGSANGIAAVASVTTTGAWIVNCTGFGTIRAIATAYTSGTATVRLTASVNTLWTYAALVGTAYPVTIAALPAFPAGANAIGDVGVQYRANATGAASRLHLVSAATTNATIVKASAGRLVGWAFSNTNAAWRYVKLHNQATAPTAGSGVVQTIAIPPNGRAELHITGGVGFATGIGLTTVTGAADSDATAVGLNDIVGDLFFA